MDGGFELCDPQRVDPLQGGHARLVGDSGWVRDLLVVFGLVHAILWFFWFTWFRTPRGPPLINSAGSKQRERYFTIVQH